jgi:hypothetical protein
MKRIVILLIIVAFGGYLIYTYHHTKTTEDTQQKAERERIILLRAKIKMEIAAMAARFTAIDNWEEKLVEGDNSGEKRVSTPELDTLWLTGRPILFQGFMRNVSTLKPTTYLILIDHLPRKGLGKLKLGTKLRLSLECPKTMVDSYLAQNPRADSRGALVAVIAKINNIESASLKTENGETEEIERGNGRCLDMHYAGLFQEMLFDK